MTPVSFTPTAVAEYRDARGWHRGNGRPDLARKFAAAVRAARARIAADPTSLPLHPGSGGLRRIRVNGFPYDLLFRVRPGGVQVLSVWNHFRDPADRPG